MNQQLLIQSGCQQWIRQPAAIGPFQQFAVSSSLAIYVHGSEDCRLLKILAQHNQQLVAICWSPVDSKLLACATSEQVIKVYNVESEGVLYSAQVPVADAIKKLCWSTHDENILLAVSGSVVGCWAYKAGDWRVLHNFKATVTCMQQSASNTRLLAVGCADGSLHLFDLLMHKVICTVHLEDGVVPCDVQFDPLSQQYLLLLCRNGSITLYGISEDQHVLSQVVALAKQPAAERSAAFVPSQPGNFLSISNKAGVLQLWNVSQQQPLKNMKTGKGPAQSVQFFPGSSKALLTFQDGTVMVYDVQTQEPLWLTEPGHTETIFDCCLHPVDHHLLATCSYDSTVRVWDIGSGSCLKTLDLPGSNGSQRQGVALYSVTWSPDGSQLAASGLDGAVYLYDFLKGVAVKKWQLHSKMSLKVAWHPVEPSLLVSSGMDGSTVAFKTDGTKITVLQHAGSTSGVAWHPFSTWQLATTSEAGPVYIWDLKQPGQGSLAQTLEGHKKRSFGVAWSPLLPELLLSGSDDATARVWDVSKGTCLALLCGHATEVRGLCWHPEVPWLVFTGSWDSTIRAWDIRNSACIYINHHHHSDVYGLSIHKSCPWVMVSASRDTTLRVWDLKGLTAGLLPRCFLDQAMPRGQAEQYITHMQPLLCGSASQQLAEWCSRFQKANSSPFCPNSTSNSCPISNLSATARVEFFQKLSEFFSAPGAAHAMWQLAAAVAVHLTGSSSVRNSLVQAQADNPAASAIGACQRTGSVGGLMQSSSMSGNSSSVRPLPHKESCGFQHVAAARAALISAANQLELSVRGRGIGKAAMGAARKEEVLIEAAMMHLQGGQVEHCCDVLVEAGEWDKALLIAPAASQEYWAKLLRRRVDAAVQGGSTVKELLPLMLAAGQSSQLTEMLLAQKQYRTAAGIAAVQACGGYQHFASIGPPDMSLLTVGTEIAAVAMPGSPHRTSIAAASPSNPPRTSAVGMYASQGTLAPLSNPPQVPSLLAPQEFSAIGMRRNNLLPLRGVGTSNISSNISCNLGTPASPALHHSLSSSGMSPAAAATALERSSSVNHPVSPGSPRPPTTSPLANRDSLVTAASGVGGRRSSLDGPGLASSSFGRTRSNSGAVGLTGAAGGTVVDGTALEQLTTVRQAEAVVYRRQGQPLLAACAALTVNDVTGAITALHLGHEPEQAAMLALALGQAGGVDSVVLDRVYGALAAKCEAAGDWDAAAAAIKLLSKDVQHHLQLLVVRCECSCKHDVAPGAMAPGVVQAESGSAQGFRQRLGLRDAAYYASAGRSAADNSDHIEGMRYLMLAGDHVAAAAKASTHLPPLLQRLQQHALLQPAAAANSSSSATQQQQCAAEQLREMQELYLWQGCIDSLDFAELPSAAWQEMFAYNLLAGALKAFEYRYLKVGSFLMSSLRRWIEQHQVNFPLTRAALLVLEADAISSSSPESACSLLIAAADGPDTPANISGAARLKLQSYPKPTTAADQANPEAFHVVPAGSCWPCRSPTHSCRSVVTGQMLEGSWVLLDDGCSVATLAEGVMLSHVMRCGPCGSGKVLHLF